MASEKKNVEAFEAAIKRELERAARSDAHDCPAPDLLAAYYERSLMRSERARVDSHLTDCARCQSMMAAIARADDSEPAPTRIAHARGFFYFARIAAPIAVLGGTIAFMVGMRTRKPPAPEVIALASPAAAPAQDSVQPLAPAPAAPVNQEPAQEPARAASQLESFAAKAAVPGARAQMRAGAAPPVAMAKVQAEEAELSSNAASTMFRRVASPDGRVTWQLGASGVVMRSDNTGRRTTLRSGTTNDLLAASAPSDDVCWIVGRSGTILRTLDRGAHWQIVKASSQDDFTTVTATDSNNATVTASDGHRYVTHDGGVTWTGE